MFQAERDCNGKLGTKNEVNSNYTTIVASINPITIDGKTVTEYLLDSIGLNPAYSLGLWATRYDDKPNNLKDLKRYIINENATILFWEDGTKTVVKRNPEDTYDKRIGFLIAYFQYTSGLSKNKANKYLDNLIEEDR